MNHFCSCPVTQCPRHPSHHNQGCDKCILDNLEKKKMPACFFKVVSADVSEVRDYTIDGFVDFYLKIREENQRLSIKEKNRN